MNRGSSDAKTQIKDIVMESPRTCPGGDCVEVPENKAGVNWTQSSLLYCESENRQESLGSLLRQRVQDYSSRTVFWNLERNKKPLSF